MDLSMQNNMFGAIATAVIITIIIIIIILMMIIITLYSPVMK